MYSCVCVCMCARAHKWVKNRSSTVMLTTIFHPTARVAFWVPKRVSGVAYDSSSRQQRDIPCEQFICVRIDILVHFRIVSHCLLVRAPINRPTAHHQPHSPHSPHSPSSLVVVQSRCSAVYWHSGNWVFMSLIIVGICYCFCYCFFFLFLLHFTSRLVIKNYAYLSHEYAAATVDPLCTRGAHVCGSYCHSGCWASGSAACQLVAHWQSVAKICYSYSNKQTISFRSQCIFINKISSRCHFLLPQFLFISYCFSRACGCLRRCGLPR